MGLDISKKNEKTYSIYLLLVSLFALPLENLEKEGIEILVKFFH
jgi:hypothetical protein